MKANSGTAALIVLVILALLCLLVTALENKAAVQEASYAIQSQGKDGIRTLTNPKDPKEGRFTANLVWEASFGEESGSQKYVLNRPVQIDVDDQGRVAVTDAGDTDIKLYDSKGRHLRTIGRRGQGPGEFGGRLSVHFGSDGKICVLDSAQRRVSQFSFNGTYVSDFAIDGFIAAMAIDGHDRVYLAKWEALRLPDTTAPGYQEIPYATRILGTDISGSELTHLVDLLGESIWVRSMAGGSGGVSPLSPFKIIWTIDLDGNMYGAYNGAYMIGKYSPDGHKQMVFGRPYDPVDNMQYRKMPGQSKVMPPFRVFTVDETGNLWVELYQKEEDRGYLYDVFSPDGIYIRQVAIDQRIAALKEGKAYAIVDENDFLFVKRYSLELRPVAQRHSDAAAKAAERSAS